MAQHASTQTCKRCGTKHQDSTSANLCCLFAPDFSGWCAWCGEDSIRVFCDKVCATSFQDDVIQTKY